MRPLRRRATSWWGRPFDPMTEQEEEGLEGSGAEGSTTERTQNAMGLFVAGAGAGMIGGSVCHPIDVVKVRMQLHGCKDGFGYGSSHVAVPIPFRRPNAFQTASTIVRTEGARALLSGLSASLLRQAAFVGTKFGAYDALKVAARPHFAAPVGGSCGTGAAGDGAEPIPGAPAGAPVQLPFAVSAALGMVAGGAGAVVGAPADLAMVRMQADGRLPVNLRRNYRNGVDAILRVCREEGVTTLWRGAGPTIGRSVVITASQLAVYERAKAALRHRGVGGADGEGLTLPVLASVAATVAATLTSAPLDVAKSRLQQQTVRAKDGRLPYVGTLDCLYKTMRAEGTAALYKGVTPTASRQLLLNAVRFVSYEAFKRQLFGD